ncbi:MAG: hypothetical protein AB1765_04135 [Candidatus Hydrogenedentota bacterium]
MKLTELVKNNNKVSTFFQYILVIFVCVSIILLVDSYIPEIIRPIEEFGMNLSHTIKTGNDDYYRLKDYETNLNTIQNNYQSMVEKNNELDKVLEDLRNETIKNDNEIETRLVQKIDTKFEEIKSAWENAINRKINAANARVYSRVKKEFSLGLENIKLEFATRVNQSEAELKKYMSAVSSTIQDNSIADDSINKITKILLEIFDNDSNEPMVNRYLTNELINRIKSNKKLQMVNKDYQVRLGGNVRRFDFFDNTVRIQVDYWLKSYIPNKPALSDTIDILCNFDQRTIQYSDQNTQQKIKKYVAQEVADIIAERIFSD